MLPRVWHHITYVQTIGFLLSIESSGRKMRNILVLKTKQKKISKQTSVSAIICHLVNAVAVVVMVVVAVGALGHRHLLFH